jgi:hypothetical protein
MISINLNGRKKKMTKHEYDPDYDDLFEYHGNTAIEYRRKQSGVTVKHDWILFDSIEEASEYFYNHCG